MVAALRLELDETMGAVVAERYAATRDADERTRCQIILLVGDGSTASEIAPVVRTSPDTVRRTVRRFITEGLDGLATRARSGRPLVVRADWVAELQRVIELPPRQVGVLGANWTTRLLAGYLAEQTGQTVSIETVRVHLHRLGYVCKRPTWTLKRKATEQEGWAKNA